MQQATANHSQKVSIREKEGKEREKEKDKEEKKKMQLAKEVKSKHKVNKSRKSLGSKAIKKLCKKSDKLPVINKDSAAQSCLEDLENKRRV